jgi:hypothetical protein
MRDVVANAVPCDVVQGFVFGYVLARPAEEDYELAFVVEGRGCVRVRDARDADAVVGVVEGGGGLVEEDGVGGDREVGFGGVGTVV